MMIIEGPEEQTSARRRRRRANGTENQYLSRPKANSEEETESVPTDEPESAPPDEPQPALVISEAVREGILAHAREGAPEEVCGILAGTRGDGPTDSRVETERRVEARHPAENVAENPAVRYEIDPREQLELMEAIEDSGHEVVGFYHSHPQGPMEPSATDAAQATWPDRSYVIVSLDGAENSERPSEVSVNSWRWTGDEFVEETVRVESSET